MSERIGTTVFVVGSRTPVTRRSPRTAPARQDSMLETRTSLLERVRDQNDLAAWEEFVRLYRPLLFNYVRSRGVQPSDAEDVVQNVLLSLMRALPTFTLDKTRGRFRSWLWQVTMSKIKDSKRREESARRSTRNFADTVPEPITDTSEPDRDWLIQHRQRILEHLLPRLKEETQEKTWACFEQHFLLGRSGVEVAARLDMKPNSVVQNAKRVLDKLRALCAEYEEEVGDGDPYLSE